MRNDDAGALGERGWAAPHPPLPHSFYDRPTTEVAQDLLGRVLVRVTREGGIAGRIVETEAYGPRDLASHAARGPSRRNAAMFGPPGFAYVYRIYGMHWCINAVTRQVGEGEAVLLRALEPVAGIDLMRRNRVTDDLHALCSGPARLCQALGITGDQDGHDLTSPELYIAGKPDEAIRVVATRRIGITKSADLEWRFCVAGSRYLSRRHA